MAFAFGLGIILVSGAGVQDLVIVQELDVARLKVHVEAKRVARSQIVEQVHRFDLQPG
jgi:hypothetical protein